MRKSDYNGKLTDDGQTTDKSASDRFSQDRPDKGRLTTAQDSFTIIGFKGIRSQTSNFLSMLVNVLRG